MRSEQELRAFFRDELAPHVERWKQSARIRPLGAVDVAVVVVAAAIGVWSGRSEAFWAIAGYGFLRVARDVARVRGAFKRDVLTRIIEFALPGVRYQPAAHIDRKLVERSGLFRESWSSAGGEDYVAGRSGETEFRFSELCLSRRSGKHHTIVFRGLFFIADFHKSFRGRTYLLPDVAERVFGSLGRSLQALPRFDGTELVELEDPDLEKRFVCYATDPVEARYLLSTALIQRIVGLAERAPGPLRLSFLDECLYLALPRPADLLSAPWLGSGVDEEAMLGWVRELFSVVGLVEELGLNTRIWSKAG